LFNFRGALGTSAAILAYLFAEEIPVSKLLSLSIILCLLTAGVSAQSKSTKSNAEVTRTAIPKPDSKPKAKPVDEELYQTIARLDTEVFDAYNQCELEKFGSYFTEELEFYHDDGGLTNKTRQGLVEALKNNICHKVRRELVPETLAVYPLRGYGAVEIGVHRFHHPGREKEDGVGEAQFVHLWQNKDGKWQITRVISFDHHSLTD
jgi:hypothetical protein